MIVGKVDYVCTVYSLVYIRRCQSTARVSLDITCVLHCGDCTL